MRIQHVLPASALIGVLLTAGCGKNVQKIPGVSTQSTTYTPVGCNYSVTVPPGVDTGQTYYPAQTMPASTAPIHVHASFPSDPSQGFAVNWAFAPPKPYPSGYPNSTDTDSLQTELIYGTSKSDVMNANIGTPSDTATGVTVQWGHTARYAASDAQGNTSETRIHEVHVCGLKPSTTYYYKVGNPGAFSDVYSIVTAPPVGSTTPISFAVSGDARDTPTVFAQAETAIASKGVSFQMFSGDAVNIALIQDEWDSFFAASTVPASIPLMTASGNHDEMAINYIEEMAIPQNMNDEESAAQGGKEWYSFNYGNVHIAVLNDTTANADAISGAEATWLDADLSAVDSSKTPWQFVFHHQPEWTCGGHQNDTAVSGAWGPIYEKHHVDIVFTGHVHNYQRTPPLINGQQNSTGVTYIVSGAVGAPLYSCDALSNCPQTMLCNATNNFGIVQISGKTLNFTAYDVSSGAQLDTLSITKP
jgi:hypothetical protein